MKAIPSKYFSYELMSAVLLLVFFSPLFFSISNVKILMHDNLDSNVVWIKNLVESGQMFANNFTAINSMMLGIPRACYPSEWAIDRLIFLFLPTQIGYAFNYILQHVVAYAGMRILIKTWISKEASIYNLAALAFAFLPFWPSGFLTVAGLPFLVYAVFSVCLNKADWKHWVIILLFPFCSSLLFGNMFSYPLLFLSAIFGVYKQFWRFEIKLLAPFVLLFILTAFVENRIISLILQGFESNRSLDIQSLSEFMNYKGIIGTSLLAFAFGHYHFHSLHILILGISLFSIVFFIWKQQFTFAKQLLLFLLIIYVLCFLMILLDNYDLRAVLGQNYKRMDLRFWVIFPLSWYLIFAFILNKWQEMKWSKLVKAGLILQLVFTMGLVYPYDYFGSRHAENIFANTWIHSQNTEQETFNNYYRITDIQKLKHTLPDINLFPVACIGLNPEILQYNKINTLEGYFSFYPAAKRKIIKEIDYQERLKTAENLDKHSNRNYLYVNDKNSTIFPAWDFNKLKINNIKYIVSNKSFLKYSASVYLKDSINYLYVYQIQ